MDHNFNALIDKLSNNTTHPNLSKLWKEYILLKKENLENAILECDNLFNSLDDLPDLNYDTMLTAYFIKSNILNDLNA